MFYYVGYSGVHTTCNQELMAMKKRRENHVIIYFVMRIFFFHKNFYYVFGRDYFEILMNEWIN
jgi:hypothetical protein